MRPDGHNLALLCDMLDAARRVVRFTARGDLESYRQDEMLRSAVERQIEIIGEAARRVSDGFRAAHPEVPWRPIIAQRNILAHDYGEIEDELVWRMATVHLPALLKQLEALVHSAG